MERATGTAIFGCGSSPSSNITLNIQTTTGGNFTVSLNGKNTIESLKKLVSRRLKVSKDRICLLYRERQLRDGTLEENGLMDGSRVILLPSVETGLLSQKPDNSVMQALESLNDTQVNDFLSGKSPLNLTMRLGDHMMLIQLQLSTLNSGSASSARSLKTSTPAKASSSTCTKYDHMESPDSQSTQQKQVKVEELNLDFDETKMENCTPILGRNDIEMFQNAFELYSSMREVKYANKGQPSKEDIELANRDVINFANTLFESDESPIMSLSNLVCSPLDNQSMHNNLITDTTSPKNNTLIEMLTSKNTSNEVLPLSNVCEKSFVSLLSPTPESSLSDDSDNFTDQSSFLAENTIDEYPMENLFNSAIDKGLFEEQDETMMDREISNLATTSHGSQEAPNGVLPSFQSLNEPLKNKRFHYLLHKTSKFKHPIGQSKQKALMQSVVNKHKKKMHMQQDTQPQPSTSRTEPYVASVKKSAQLPNTVIANDNTAPSTSKSDDLKTPEVQKKQQRASPTPPIDTKALIEASKNLTQKLKKLSKEVLTNKLDLKMAEESLRSKIGPGAVIESMKHHGKGIYSGTFSGTLNPALQDRYGRPKRDISTIIHILNDLLCASPPLPNLTQKDAKLICSLDLSDETKKCTCNQSPCSFGQCDGHTPGSSNAAVKQCSCKIDKNCHCIRLDANQCSACAATKSITGELCKKCHRAKTLAMENSKTKCKVEQLRLVMQQKKQRREARKLKTLPYAGAPPKGIGSPDPSAPIQEEIETVS